MLSDKIFSVFLECSNMKSPESSPLVLLALESQSEGEEEAGKGNSTSVRTGKSVQLESSHSWNVFMEEELVGSILAWSSYCWLLADVLAQKFREKSQRFKQHLAGSRQVSRLSSPAFASFS